MPVEILTRFGTSFLDILLDVSFYFLLGLLGAGIMKAFVDERRIVRRMGRKDFASVVNASLFGIPLPLCSCSVIPVALSLRRQGASKGATVSFLVSTPESGVDSIAISYALLDPLMTVFRPVAAFVTAITAGISENTFGVRQKPVAPLQPISGAAVKTQSESAQTAAVCNCNEGKCPTESNGKNDKIFFRLLFGIRYAFNDLLKDIALYFFIGLMLAAAISAFLPERLFTQNYVHEWQSMLVMLALGIPLYVCASASTPLAAAFILKGVSPGATLVFLLAGPATNLATLTVIKKTLGLRSALIYVLSIAGVALIMGVILNGIYGYFGISVITHIGEAAKWIPGWAQYFSAFILAPLLTWHSAITVYRKYVKKQPGYSSR